MTRSVGWVWAIAGIIALGATGAVGLMLGSASLAAPAGVYFSQVDYSPEGQVAIDPEEDAYYNQLSARGSQLYFAALPFMLTMTAGPFVLLAVLGARWDARPRVRIMTDTDAPDQAEASATAP